MAFGLAIPLACAKPADKPTDMAVATKATAQIFSMVSSSLGETLQF
jgi:hypothetical protein